MVLTLSDAVNISILQSQIQSRRRQPSVSNRVARRKKPASKKKKKKKRKNMCVSYFTEVKYLPVAKQVGDVGKNQGASYFTELNR